MFIIKSIHIKGFKDASRECYAEFSTVNISVVYGENGSGKTTLLRIMNAIFSQSESVLIKEKVESILLRFQSDISGALKDQTIKVSLVTDENSSVDSISDSITSKKYNWEEFEKSDLSLIKTLSIGVHRGISTQTVRIDPDLLFFFFRQPSIRNKIAHNMQTLKEISDELAGTINTTLVADRRKQFTKHLRLLENNHTIIEEIKIEEIEQLLVERYFEAKRITSAKIQNALFATLALAINQEPVERITLPDDFIFKLNQNKESLIEALSEVSDNQFKNELIDIIKKTDDIKKIDQHLSNPLLTNLLIKMMEELQIEEQILNSVNILIESFNQQIQKNKKLTISRNGVVIKIGKRHHTIEELSSGERHLLTFLTIVLIDVIERDILIIDEPEISLNIIWQEKLLPLISKLAPKTQIIAASHSASIAKKNSNYLVKLKVIEGL